MMVVTRLIWYTMAIITLMYSANYTIVRNGVHEIMKDGQSIVRENI